MMMKRFSILSLCLYTWTNALLLDDCIYACLSPWFYFVLNWVVRKFAF